MLFPFNPLRGVSGTRFTRRSKDRWTNVTYISKPKHKTTDFIGNMRKQCMNNIHRYYTLKLTQINKQVPVQYLIEGDQSLNHCSYMLMNSTENDFICVTSDHCKKLLHLSILYSLIIFI